MNDPAGSPQQNNNRTFEATYYARQKVNNMEDGLSLTYSFNRGLMIPAISSRPQGYDSKPEELASVNLSQMKAGILADRGDKFLKADKSDTRLYAVDTGIGETRGLIGFRNDTATGKRQIVIGKISSTGEFSGTEMNFHDDEYYYGLLIENMATMDFTKEPVKEDLELRAFIQVLEDFNKAMNGAVAYSVADLARYDHNRINNTLNLIAEAMNIDTKMNQNKGGSKSGTSYFDRQKDAGSHKSEHMSADDVDQMLS